MCQAGWGCPSQSLWSGPQYCIWALPNFHLTFWWKIFQFHIRAKTIIHNFLDLYLYNLLSHTFTHIQDISCICTLCSILFTVPSQLSSVSVAITFSVLHFDMTWLLMHFAGFNKCCNTRGSCHFAQWGINHRAEVMTVLGCGNWANWCNSPDLNLIVSNGILCFHTCFYDSVLFSHLIPFHFL